MPGVQTTVSRLHDGDCFFYDSPDMLAQQHQRLESVNQLLRDAGMDEVTLADLELTLKSFAEAHIVYTVVRSTGHVTSQRVSDGAKFIWYWDVPVEWVDRREEFEQALTELHERRRLFEEVLAKAQRDRTKSRKRAKQESEELRTH